jgi:hypothetical protein
VNICQLALGTKIREIMDRSPLLRIDYSEAVAEGLIDRDDPA